MYVWDELITKSVLYMTWLKLRFVLTIAISIFKDARSVSFRSDLFTSYI